MTQFNNEELQQLSFQHLFELMPGPMLLVDENGLIELSNSNAERTFQFERNELIGQSIEVLIPDTYRSGHAGLMRNFFLRPNVRTMASGKRLFGYRKDKTEIQIEVLLNPIQTESGTKVICSIVDISTRLQLEQNNLIEIRKDILDHTNFAIISCDTNGVIQVFNKRAERMFGILSKELLGKNIDRLITFNDALEERALQLSEELGEKIAVGFDVFVAKARQSRMADEFEWEIIRENGTIIPVLLSITPHIDQHQNLTGFLAMLIDISDRKLQLQKAKNQDALFRVVYETSSVAHLLLTQKEGIISGNLAAVALFGYTSIFELIHLPQSAISPEFQPDGSRSDEKSREMIQLAINYGSNKFEWLLQRSDGSHFYADIVLSRFIIDEKIIVQAIIRNITERKNAVSALLESERRLNFILDTCPTAVRITKRGSMKFSYYNSSYLAITNTDDQTIHHFDPSAYYDPKTYGEIMESLSNGENITDKLVELKNSGDPEFGIKWVLASYFNITYEDQPATIGWFHEITERILLEKLKTEFISTVSHELRTPLTSISASLALIANKVFGEIPVKAHQLVELAYRNSLRLTNLVNDLLDMDKLAAGKLVFELQHHLLAPILKRSIEDNTKNQHERLITLIFSGKPEFEYANVSCDVRRLLQVLSHLLSNAIKYSPDDGQVLIDCVFSGQNNEEIKITITDQGPGIPAEFHQRLFQKFSQADSSDVRLKGGTGLGLAVSRELIEQMGGKIGFTSILGQGACFYITLPVAQAGPVKI